MSATDTKEPLAAVPDEEEYAGPEGRHDDLEPEVEEAPKPTPPMQIAIPGTEPGITDVAGGAQPTSTEMRLMGGSIPIEGQFDGEEVVQLLVEAKVGAVEIIYTTDDWGETKAVKRRHKARMLSVTRVGTA